MVGDSVRSDAYARALRKCIRPNSTVLDIGTGVGIWALLACQLGARRVYAIEPNDVIQVAREIAAANGYADRIEFIQDISTRIDLPEQADIIVTEMHGILPTFEQNLASIIDARQRLLAPGGKIIPERETLWAAPVAAPESYEQVALPWANNPYGFDMRPAMRIAKNDWFKTKGNVAVKDFFAKPKCWTTLDYGTLDSPNVNGELTWTATRAGTGHGLVIWFETVLVDGVSFSNAPGSPETIFGQAFFPWSEPVSISIGDRISVELRADLVGDYYLWRWETSVRERECPETFKAEFKQSTFFSVPLSPSTSRERAADHIPKLNQDGQIAGLVLSLMNGENSLQRIASQTVTQFPNYFSNRDDANTIVADLSEKYTKKA